jgi:hypothetical protein
MVAPLTRPARSLVRAFIGATGEQKLDSSSCNRCDVTRTALRVLVVALVAVTPCVALAQTTEFHLHDEGSGDFCCKALKTIGPDIASSLFRQSVDLKNHGTEHGTLVSSWFKTLENAPNWYGVIASGSAVRFRLWMKKTSNWGVVYPEAQVRLNDGGGQRPFSTCPLDRS